MGGKISKKKKLITLTFSKSELQEMQQAFNLFDLNKDGEINITELDQVMKQLNKPMTKSEIKRMMSEIDLDEDGVIDFGEFLIMMKRYQLHKERNEDIRKLFAAFDVRGTGKITAADLKVAMTKLGEEVTDEDIAEMMKEAGADKNNVITYNAFRLLCDRLCLL